MESHFFIFSLLFLFLFYIPILLRIILNTLFCYTRTPPQRRVFLCSGHYLPNLNEMYSVFYRFTSRDYLVVTAKARKQTIIFLSIIITFFLHTEYFTKDIMYLNTYIHTRIFNEIVSINHILT